MTLDIVSEPRSGYSRPRVRRFAMKLQQFTGPVMAKAVEDTAFYRYHRLLALNEVGGDPVSLLLGKQDLASEMGALGPALEHLPELLRRPDRVPTRLREQVEEHVVLGD